MQAEPDYLTKNHIRIYDPKNNELPPSQIDWYSAEAVNYKFKQDAGDFNSLGSMKINFPVPTASTCMTRPQRGCSARISALPPRAACACRTFAKLVYWILADSPGWSKAEIDEVIKSGERKDAKVRQGVAAVLGLRHGLGDPRRRGPVPRRYLQPRRAGGGEQFRRRPGAGRDPYA
ncbi:MAG: hypothetical protein WDN50_20390 [Bradyrhizobium sp.]